MTSCAQTAFHLPPAKRRRAEAEFSGSEVPSDGGVLLLRQAERRLGLPEAVDAVIRDPRYIKHGQLSLLRQPVYGLCLGYEDLNDHDARLRTDPAIQTAVERDDEPGGQSTLCRPENRMDREVGWRVHEVLLKTFIGSTQGVGAGFRRHR